MTKNNSLLLIKICLINLIPVFGILFLEWQIFEIAFSFLLDTMVLFVFSYFDHYIINKTKKESTLLTVMQFINNFLLLTVITLILIGFINYITEIKSGTGIEIIDKVAENLLDFQYVLILPSIIFFNGIYFWLTKNTEEKDTTIWKVLERIFYLYMFITIAGIIFGILPYMSGLGLSLFIIAKIFIDYFLNRKPKQISIQN